MFERVCMRESPETRHQALDLGALAEAMLFYQECHVVGRKGALEQLAQGCGADVLERVLSEGFVQLKYRPEFPSVRTEGTGTPDERHAPTVVSFSGLELERILPEVLSEVVGARGRGRRAARRIEKHVSKFAHAAAQIEEHSASDFRDEAYVAAGFRVTLSHLVPEYQLPEPLRVSVREMADGMIKVATNIDFAGANAVYHRRVPASHSTLSHAYLLAHLVTLREDLDMAASLEADLSVTEITADLAKLKVEEILQRYSKSAEEIGRFQDLVLDDTRALREAINSGEKTMSDFMKVLERAQRFREWLRGRPADASLVKEYYRAVTSGTWIEKLPGKVARFVIVTAAGTALAPAGVPGFAAGVAIGAADAFLLEPMVRGWRPNQFVEGPLKAFVG